MPDLRRVQIPIRLRLTLWYVLLMAITFAAFGVFLFFRFQSSLMNTIDRSLDLAVTQTLSTFDLEEDYKENGRLAFEEAGAEPPAPGFAMRLVSAEGAIWDIYGVDPGAWGSTQQGYTTQQATSDDGERRLLTKPILGADGKLIGWVQASQSLEAVTESLQDFRDQMLWGVPFLLLLAGSGGYFLATRALRPIENITHTAQEITAHDLSQRLDYRGPADEVGRLARTFDEMLERLQAAFRRERRFTSDAAHELRTPLTVLKGQIEVALSRPRQRAEYVTKLHELAAQVERLIRLSNALLFLSSSDQNELSWSPKLLKLVDVLEVILEQIQPLAEENGLALQADISGEILLYGDPDHLTRLFLNLLDNAVKYTPAGGQITLQAVQEPAETLIAIHNSGPGIPPEHLPQLFDRFYRVDGHRSSQSGGSGLGLAIAQEIARQHGGEISAQSTAGEGATFTLRLPKQKLS
jgi:heavy metal sensor kinase